MKVNFRLPPESDRLGPRSLILGPAADVILDEGRIAHLRVVRLRVHGREVAALEAFDERGGLALSIAGTRDAAGFQAAAWTAFLGEIRRGLRPMAVAS